MDELWQIYDEQGHALVDKGAKKDDVFGNGILHGASHVWIWRKDKDTLEILLQKRAANKRTWPNRYDISAAGHIDLGETPLDAALREMKEEINLEVNPQRLKLFGVHRAYLKANDGTIENEFQWLYSLKITSDRTFDLQASEVESIVWMPIDKFRDNCADDQYVPHGKLYYDTVVSAIRLAT